MATVKTVQLKEKTSARFSSVPGLPAVTTVALALIVSIFIMLITMLGAFGLYRWHPRYLKVQDVFDAAGFGNAIVHASINDRDFVLDAVQNVSTDSAIPPLNSIDILMETLVSRRRQRSFLPDLRFPVSERSNTLSAGAPFLTAGLAAYPAERLLQLAAAALLPNHAEEKQQKLLVDLVRETAVRNGISPSAMSVEAVRPSDSDGGTTTRLMAILSGPVTPEMLHQAVSRTVHGKDIVTEEEPLPGQKSLIKVYFKDSLCVELLCITPVEFGERSSVVKKSVTPSPTRAGTSAERLPSPGIVAAEERIPAPPKIAKAYSALSISEDKKSPPPWDSVTPSKKTEASPPLPEQEPETVPSLVKEAEAVPSLPVQPIVPPEPSAPREPVPAAQSEPEPEIVEEEVYTLPVTPLPESEPVSAPAPPALSVSGQEPLPAASPVPLAEVAPPAPSEPVAALPESASLTPVPEPVAAEDSATEESRLVTAPTVVTVPTTTFQEAPASPDVKPETSEEPVLVTADVAAESTDTGVTEVLPDPLLSPKTETEITPPESSAPESEILLARNVVPVETYPSAEQAEIPATEGEPGKTYLGIVLDDGGYGGDEMTRVMELDNRLTLAILPDTPFASETVQLAVENGFEIMVHMPMQAGHGSKNRFPGELTIGMTRDQIQQRTRECLDQFPEAVGVNNHTGGLFTTYPEKMGWFLEVVKAEQMYFVDSRTVGSSCAYDKAVEAGIPAVRRDLFLDHSNSLSDIRKRFNELVEMAKRRGSAVGIGHFRPNTITVLAEKLPGLEALGIELVPLSELVW